MENGPEEGMLLCGIDEADELLGLREKVVRVSADDVMASQPPEDNSPTLDEVGIVVGPEDEEVICATGEE